MINTCELICKREKVYDKIYLTVKMASSVKMVSRNIAYVLSIINFFSVTL